jgi:integrase
MATIVARKRNDGSTAYTAQIRIKRGGVVIHSESKTFAKRATAKAWATAREEVLKLDPSASGKATEPALTLADLITRYIAAREAIEPLGRSKGHHLKLLLSFDIAQKSVLSITSRDLVEHVRVRRASGTGPSTVSNDLIWMRVVFRYARTALGIPILLQPLDDAAELCKQERMIARPNKRRRRPTDDELSGITGWFKTKRSGPPMVLLMWFAIYSCRRLSEICALKLSDLNREHSTWMVRDLKNPAGSKGNDHEMRVTDRLWPVIEAAIVQVPRQDDRLFPINPKTVGTYWLRQLKLLGIEDLHFHDLRHEAASRLAEDGLTIPEIQQVSLHESWGSLQIYVQIRPRKAARVEWDSI